LPKQCKVSRFLPFSDALNSRVIALSTKKNALAGVDPSRLTTLLEAATDISLVIDKKGKITAAMFAASDLASELHDALVGRLLADTVTEDSRARVEELLDTAGGDVAVARDLVHRLPSGAEFPVRYGAGAVFADGRVILMGRDLRAITALQQQVLDAQKALEQDYWRLRHVEARYRLLFEMAGEPLLIVDEASRRVLEANPLADRLLSSGARSIIGKAFPLGFDKAGNQQLSDMLLEARAVGRAMASEVRSADGSEEFSVSITLLRQGDESRFLIRLASTSAADVSDGEAASCIDNVMRHAPDGMVLTDSEGRIRAANQTFLDLAQLASEEQIVGRSLDRWLGRSGVDLSVLLTNLRDHGAVRLFATKLRSEFGTSIDVEISATLLDDEANGGFAFFIRDVGRRLSSEPAAGSALPRSVEQITQQVGRVPLKELVRQSTDLVERLCIETALALTGDNRASAAELLGVSRQGLYAKLNRYNLADKATQD
jgi:transcriptional regulator PpsR